MADKVVIKPMFTLSTARTLAGMSTKDAAKALGISERTLISYEKGRTVPRMDLVNKMVDLYGIPIDHLVFDLRDLNVNDLALYE